MPAADAAREGPAHAAIEEASEDLTMKYGAGFAVAVVGIMLAEQTLMNASVLIVNGHSGRALAGFVFNVMLIVRAPLQLFQAIQTSILPHLAGLEARDSPEDFHKAIRLTILAIAAFAGAVALGLLLIGPAVMTALLGNKGFTYGRFGLALVGLGMGLHLVSGTLNQAALARNRAQIAAVAWLIAAACSSCSWRCPRSATRSPASRSATSAPRCCCASCSAACTAWARLRRRRQTGARRRSVRCRPAPWRRPSRGRRSSACPGSC